MNGHEQIAQEDRQVEGGQVLQLDAVLGRQPEAQEAQHEQRADVDAGYTGRLARVSSKDSFVPLGDAARLVLLSEDEIEAAALRLVS